MSRKILTVVAVAKNEAHNIPRWHESVKEADHIVVLCDPYSTDGTTELFQSYPDVHVEVVEVKPWRWDVARNKA